MSYNDICQTPKTGTVNIHMYILSTTNTQNFFYQKVRIAIFTDVYKNIINIVCQFIGYPNEINYTLFFISDLK